jgi:hypothetical protein
MLLLLALLLGGGSCILVLRAHRMASPQGESTRMRLAAAGSVRLQRNTRSIHSHSHSLTHELCRAEQAYTKDDPMIEEALFHQLSQVHSVCVYEGGEISVKVEGKGTGGGRGRESALPGGGRTRQGERLRAGMNRRLSRQR